MEDNSNVCAENADNTPDRTLLNQLRANYKKFEDDAEPHIQQSIDYIKNEIIVASKGGYKSVFIAYCKLYRDDLYHRRYTEWVKENGLHFGKDDTDNHLISVSGMWIHYK
jgi:hypothetical protein